MRVKINCGGTVFETTEETLSESGFFSGDWRRFSEGQDNEIFLDQDPEAFAVVLRYLRSKQYGTTCTLQYEPTAVLKRAYSLADYLLLPQLQERIEGVVSRIDGVVSSSDKYRSTERAVEIISSLIADGQHNGQHISLLLHFWSEDPSLKPAGISDKDLALAATIAQYWRLRDASLKGQVILVDSNRGQMFKPPTTICCRMIETRARGVYEMVVEYRDIDSYRSVYKPLFGGDRLELFPYGIAIEESDMRLPVGLRFRVECCDIFVRRMEPVLNAFKQNWTSCLAKYQSMSTFIKRRMALESRYNSFSTPALICPDSLLRTFGFVHGAPLAIENFETCLTRLLAAAVPVVPWN